MFTRALGVLVVGLTLLCLAATAGAGGKDKDKDTPKKGEIPKNAIHGTMKSVDLKGSSFTMTLDSGKDRTFKVDKDTKFIGPRGGISDDGLKDDRLEKGYEVNVVADSVNGKSAKEVHLPMRKSKEKDKKK